MQIHNSPLQIHPFLTIFFLRGMFSRKDIVLLLFIPCTTTTSGFQQRRIPSVGVITASRNLKLCSCHTNKRFNNVQMPSLRQVWLPLKILSSKPIERVPSRTFLAVTGNALALNTGFLNAMALSGAVIAQAQPVTACTGCYTTAAMGMANSQFLWRPLATIACYFSGSFIAGVIHPKGVDWDSRLPLKGLLVSAALVWLTTTITDSSLIWYLTTAACGLQNSLTSQLIAGNVLRTAHFSGITSDIGTVLGQSIRGNRENLWKAPIWATLMTSFVAGSFLSVHAMRQWGRMVALFPVASYLSVALATSLRQWLFSKQQQEKII